MPALNLSLSLSQPRGGGGAWSPAALFASGEDGFWYDPSDLATVWQDNGSTPSAVNDVIGRIDDKSGRGRHQLQATSSLKPRLKQSGSVLYIEGDGVDDWLAAASAASFGHDFTLLVAWKPGTTMPTHAAIFQLTATDYSNVGTFTFAKGSLTGESGLWTDGAYRLSYAQAGFHLTEFVKSAAVITRRVNGGAAMTYNAAADRTLAPTASGISIGITSPYAGNQQIAGVIGVNRTLTSDEAAKARTYLGAKIGLSI